MAEQEFSYDAIAGVGVSPRRAAAGLAPLSKTSLLPIAIPSRTRSRLGNGA